MEIDDDKSFELGKCYENRNGLQIHVCGKVDTIMMGPTYICEVGDVKGGPNSEIRPYFEPIDWYYSTGYGMRGWSEIPKEKFMLDNFHISSENEMSEMREKILLFNREMKIKKIKKSTI